MAGRFPFWLDVEAEDLGRLSPKRVAADIANYEAVDWSHPVCSRLSDPAKQLLSSMLRRDAAQRTTAAEALSSAFMAQQ
jgi:hypothetical protein